jgi:DNA (cytosine-5)-methyltransferase 1
MIHISLFSGIGGFELAAEWMGWRNLVSCDINEFGNKVREYYWPDGYCHRDVKTLTYETIDQELSDRYGLGWRDDDIILTGGFPCQPYSAAGKRLGKEDERHLWPEMLRVISEVKPTYIVGENVRGLTNWNGGVVFEEVCADLENIGYEVQPVLLPACAVNAPHRRDRIWFVAYAKNNGCNQRGQETYRREKYQSCNGEKLRNITTPNGKESDVTHPNRNGQHGSNRQHEVNTSERGFNALGDINESNGNGDVADTENKGLQGSEVIGGTGSIRTDRNKFASRRFPSNWQNFPTQPPVCSGDDGLPNRLDNITFSKWRNESIKAYGNAIVPQVAYQIFKALIIK